MNEYFQLFVLFNKKIRVKLNYLVLYDKQAITVCPGPIVVFLILNLFYIQRHYSASDPHSRPLVVTPSELPRECPADQRSSLVIISRPTRASFSRISFNHWIGLVVENTDRCPGGLIQKRLTTHLKQMLAEVPVSVLVLVSREHKQKAELALSYLLFAGGQNREGILFCLLCKFFGSFSRHFLSCHIAKATLLHSIVSDISFNLIVRGIISLFLGM